MSQVLFDGLAEEIDAAHPQTFAAAPGAVGRFSAGQAVSGVVSALRAAGVPWMTIFALMAKIVPIVLQGIKDGKNLMEIVSEVIAAILGGQLAPA